MPREVFMKRILYLLALLFFLFLQPVGAQDGGDDDEPEIEIGEDDGGSEPSKDEDEELRKIRKKNSGLAGGGEANDDDANAPKVKLSLQQRINAAIKNGVAWLKKRQEKDGSWGPVTASRKYGEKKASGKYIRDPTGPTSWAIYTLSKCGVKKSDPVIRKGYKWLQSGKKPLASGSSEQGLTGQTWGAGKAYDVTGDKSRHYRSSTYESASLIMMLEAMHTRSAKLTGRHKSRRLYSKNPLKPPSGSKMPKDDWKWMHDRVVWLTVGRRGKRTIQGCQNSGGGWRYGQAKGDQDLSATQFAVLALRAASQAGYPVTKVAPNTWRYAAQYAKECQLGNGGFGYQKGQGWSAGMTACGIGILLICKEQMELNNQEPPSWIDNSIQRGLKYLDEVWDANHNKGTHSAGSEHFYYLYGVERVGDLTGRSEFGGQNWYVRGAEYLLAHQDANGKWTDSTGFPPRDVLGTCFALLFLKRATPPVVTPSRD